MAVMVGNMISACDDSELRALLPCTQEFDVSAVITRLDIVLDNLGNIREAH